MSPADSTIALGKHTLKVRLAAHRGRVVLDLRYFYLPPYGGPLKPGRRGVTIPASALPDVLHALEKIKEQMIRDGALTYDGDGIPPKFTPQVYPTDF